LTPVIFQGRYENERGIFRPYIPAEEEQFNIK
jgi:hypothetical protein